MTATTTPTQAVATAPSDRTPAVGRLTAVELRKMTDTRSGFWLLLVVALIAVGVVGVQLFVGNDAGRAMTGFFAGTLLPVNVLLPVLGILSVTSEWSQRTAVVTFTLVPARWRTAVAKLLAGTALAALSVVACLAAAAVGNLLVGPLVDGNGSWTLEASLIGTAFVFQWIGLLMGIAFGMLFMNTPAAIVLYFLIPTVWSIAGQFTGALATARQWVDQTVTLAPLTSGAMTGDSWAKVGATVGVWVALPLAAGLVRLMRREVS